MAQITSNTFTINVNRETDTPTATTKTITSNTFTINVNRETDTPTATTKTITSNTFTINVNRGTNTEDDLTTKVIIYKGVNELTAVNHTPSVGEYQVTITGTKNCTAKLKADNKTIKLLSVSSSAGQINIAINVESVKTYNKSISVASIISNEVVHESIVKQSQLEQNLDGFKTTVSATYQTKDDMKDYSTTSAMNSAINQKANEITSTVSQTYATQSTTNSMLTQIQQNANNISTKVDVNGVISSINQSAESVSINASKINLNGYVSNDEESWSITSDGLFNAKDVAIDGELSVDTITCNKINNPNYPDSLSGNVQVYVNASTGSDDVEFEEGVVFQSVNGALEALPRCLNNWEVKIMLQTDVTENITIRNKNTGRLHIQLNNKTLYGWIDVVQNMGLQVFLLGGTNGSASTSDYGYIKPTQGKARTGGVFPIAALDTFSFTLYNIAVYAPTVDQSATKGALHVSNFTKAYINNLKIYHTLSGSTFSTGFDNMIRTYSNSYVYIAESHGLTKNYTYFAQSGSTICLNNDTQAGRYNSTARINKNSGGEIRWVTEPTWDGNGSTGSSDASSTVTTKTYTNTYKSNYGDTYRSTKYNNWKKDGTVRQGEWGYGNCTGVWFFGTQFADVKGKNITKVTITIARQSGGISSAREHKLWMHGHTSRPSGAPSLTSGWSKTFDLAVGNSTPITITNSTVLNAIKNGTCKGFAIRHTYDNAHYSVCSGSVTVKITYTE